jgi:hypothetical protein
MFLVSFDRSAVAIPLTERVRLSFNFFLFSRLLVLLVNSVIGTELLDFPQLLS